MSLLRLCNTLGVMIESAPAKPRGAQCKSLDLQVIGLQSELYKIVRTGNEYDDQPLGEEDIGITKDVILKLVGHGSKTDILPASSAPVLPVGGWEHSQAQRSGFDKAFSTIKQHR